MLSGLEPKAETILGDYARFFREYPEAQEITPSEFWFCFKAWHPTITSELLPFYDTLINVEIMKPVPDALRDGLTNRLVAAD